MPPVGGALDPLEEGQHAPFDLPDVTVVTRP
jgi:hypothetical protein